MTGQEPCVERHQNDGRRNANGSRHSSGRQFSHFALLPYSQRIFSNHSGNLLVLKNFPSLGRFLFHVESRPVGGLAPLLPSSTPLTYAFAVDAPRVEIPLEEVEHTPEGEKPRAARVDDRLIEFVLRVSGNKEAIVDDREVSNPAL